MIYVHDKGRLCNNILQYGHLYAWGREHKRETMSMRFAYKYRYFKIGHTKHHHFLYYLYAKYGAKCGLIPVVHFDAEGADYSEEETLMLHYRNVVVEGWYARWYDLFLKYKRDIISLFMFVPKIRVSMEAKLSGLPAADLRLGIHIRRGDYQTWHGGRYYFTDEQYINVIRQFLVLQKGKTIQMFICGNDPELDEEAYRQTFLEQTVIFPKGNPGEDLFLLSECDYLIGPPSTFTLVAAMYRDLPLCWIENADAKLTLSSFAFFDELLKKIK